MRMQETCTVSKRLKGHDEKSTRTMLQFVQIKRGSPMFKLKQKKTSSSSALLQAEQTQSQISLPRKQVPKCSTSPPSNCLGIEIAC